MIFYILDSTTELWMTKYIIGEIFSSGRATLYKNPSDQTVRCKWLKSNTITDLAATTAVPATDLVLLIDLWDHLTPLAKLILVEYVHILRPVPNRHCPADFRILY